MVGAVRGDRTVLPQGGQGSSACGAGADASDVLRAALVQPGREACEEMLLDSTVLRRFVGIHLCRERVPDATRLLKFRRLLETRALGAELFLQVNRGLEARGLTVGTGKIVDTTIIAAPSSTKHAGKARDPEMHRTRKGQQWTFEMKLHIGVDSRTGLTYSAAATAANVHKHLLGDLLHGEERHEPHQVADSRARRACVCGGEAAVGLHQGALLRPGQERQPQLRGTVAGEPVPGAYPTDGISAPAGRCAAPKVARDTPNSRGYCREPINRRVRTGSAEPAHIVAT